MEPLERDRHGCGIARRHRALAVKDPFRGSAGQRLHVRHVLSYQVERNREGGSWRPAAEPPW